MTDKNKIAGRCPFCGGRMDEKRGIYGDLYFFCQNPECGANVTFPSSNFDETDARRRFRRRAGGKRQC